MAVHIVKKKKRENFHFPYNLIQYVITIIACNGTPTKKIIQMFSPITNICRYIAIKNVHNVPDAAKDKVNLYFFIKDTTVTNKQDAGIGHIKDNHNPLIPV